jgi:hypothetical protein
MKSIKLALVVFITLVFATTANAGTAFYTGEKVTGMTKQCYYKFLGSQYTRTMRAIDICPLNIQV